MSRSNDIAGLTTSILDGVTATEVGLGNVTNESKATMFASPTFTGTVSGVTASHITSGTLGNTVQDNITRLGTVTTGTMNNTIGGSATFPAGIVLQVIHDTTRETNTIDTTFRNYYEQSIQLKSASSDVFGIFMHGWSISGVNEGFALKVFRNNSATVTDSHTLVYNPTVTDATGPLHGYANSRLKSSASYNFKDTLSGFSAGDTLYYGFFFKQRSNNATIQIPPYDSQNGVFSLTLMEVQK